MSKNKETKPPTERKRRPRSTKSALIKAMSHRLPSAILESPLFAQRLREIMCRYARIYTLYQKDQLYYIGLIKNLWGRIRWHLRDRHSGKWDSFIITIHIQRVGMPT